MPAIIDKIAWLHLRGGEVLRTRSRGNKREFGETDQQSLLREIKEESVVDFGVRRAA